METALAPSVDGGARDDPPSLKWSAPDVLDALPGVDLAPLLPEWLPGTKVAAFLAVARFAARAYATKLAALLAREPPR